ncbi:alpha-N-acetylglucosaminidase TIM-barrel domain-containing protein [Paenibacillus sp. SAF-054]|uniref:alpha-N-acetylglucosaminidase TIM-barrel domain-containing protein n=1 Tax=unclassified Paenibacillus TaxID=185978 RepID=UPI003F7EC4A6
MKKVILLACLVFSLVTILGTVVNSPILSTARAEPAAFDTKPAVDVLKRLVPNHYDQVRFIAVPLGEEGENFRITSKDGLVEISGTSPAVLLTGFNWYLKYVAKANINWNGDQLNLPEQLPLPKQEMAQKANVPHRFALNDTDDGYTGAYRNWQDWERMIDVLALNGINEVLVTVGQEAVYYDIFQEFGYTAQEMNDWIPQPSHQPWWLLQNMCCFTGPVTENLINERALLGKKIADHMRELGMTPVFPGYFGTVPAKFTDKNPGARIIPQGNWVGFNRPDWLDPRSALFPQVAESFYRNQVERFGTTTMFKMDLLHEGGSAGDVPVGTAAKAVETALQAAHPGAIWAILGWQNNPSSALLSSLDQSKMLILDGLSDRYANLNREQSWVNVPYAYGSIWNFGGHTTMGANVAEWNTSYWKWKAKSGSKLSGIALMPEGSENNPVAFDFFTEIAWQKGPVDLEKWFDTWAERRYGATDQHAQAAWQTLRQTAYQTPANGWSESQDGLFGAQPSLTANTSAAWSPTSMRYDGLAFDQALPDLLGVKPELRNNDAFRYDLMDVTRQVLSNRSRTLLPQIKAAYDARDLETFNKLTGTWLQWMKLLDEVVATNSQTLLGPRLESAKSMASSAAERARLEYDVRSILTVWGDRSGSTSGGLHDYANREWAGLVGDYYYSRWSMYFDELKAALSEGRPEQQIDWYAVGEAWARQQNRYATEPQGDIYQVAQKVMNEISSSSPLGMTVTADKAVITPGTPAAITATLKNDYSFTSAKEVAVSVAPNSSFTVKAQTPTTIEQIQPGESFTVKFEVTATSDLTNLDHLLQALSVESTYRRGDQMEKMTGKLRLLVSKGVQSPYKTVSFNNAQFGQSGDQFGIYGGGEDLWGGTNGFGAIYQKQALTGDASVTTRVDHQDNTWGWARAGIIVRNDLTANGSGGYVNIAVTPSNGCVLSWDANGDGMFESVSSKAGFAAPAYIKLDRAGSKFTGSCSSDGTTWTTVGTANVPSSAEQQDVGLFMSAVNVSSRINGLVEFNGFSINTKGIPVTGITMGKPQLTLNLDTNKTEKLIATVAPNHASNKAVVWTSNHPNVATLDSDGMVTAKGKGTAIITATTVDGGFKATTEIKVVETGPFATGVQLDQATMTLIEGETSELTASVLPLDAWNRNVTWSSSSDAIAKVQASGGGKAVVTGLKAGQAKITVTSVDGDFKATSQVTVLPRPANLALNKPSTASSSSSPSSKGNDGDSSSMWIANGGSAGNWWAVDLGDNYDLSGSEIHFEKQVLWKYKIEVSKDKSSWITVVDKMDNTDTSQVQSHHFSAQGRHVRITFDQAPGQNWTAFQELLVFGHPLRVPVTGVQIDQTAITLKTGESVELTATVTPSGATDKSVTWSSSDESIAKVTVKDGHATVTGFQAGTATITATSVDGGHTAASLITVEPETPRAPVTTLQGDPSVPAGQQFHIDYGLSHLTKDIFAQDIAINYDSNVFEYVSVQSLIEGFNLLETVSDIPGKLRLIAASQGQDYAVTGDAPIFEVTFQANNVSQPSSGSISISKALLGDRIGDEETAAPSSLNIQVTVGGLTGDLNHDGKISIGDLAVAAAYYGFTEASRDWQKAKAADMNRDGKIDIADLAAIAALMTSIS